MGFIIVYITHPNLKTAKKIVSELLKKRLVASANIFPVQSSYWWKGRINSAKEFVSIVKTRFSYWESIKSAITKVHPYEVPCIIRIPVEANHEYERWLHFETENIQVLAKKK